MPPAENRETPEYSLPPPIETDSGDVERSPEKNIQSPETTKNPVTYKLSNPKTQITDFQLPGSTGQSSTTVVPQTTISDNPQIADDNDLIEKEWVAKAKKIIDDNREDPYNQSKEMTLFKADYMKKRYNKAIKVSE